VALAVLAACAATPQPQSNWVRTRDQAPPFEEAEERCKTHALRVTAAIQPAGAATKAAAGEFLRCMERLGWRPEKTGTE
jgi:hypothetical protein